MHEKEVRPYGRTSTIMPFGYRKIGRISGERLVSLDAKLSLDARISPRCTIVLQSPAKRPKLYQNNVSCARLHVV